MPMPQSSTPATLLSVLWISAITDLESRFLCLAMKAIFAIVPFPKQCSQAQCCHATSTHEQAFSSQQPPVSSSTASSSSIPPSSPQACSVLSRSHFRAKRRLFVLLETAFLVYRSVLPLPVWCNYYYDEGDNNSNHIFVGVYLTLKAMVISTHMRRFMTLLRVYILHSGSPLVGRAATQSELTEAGNPDCPICYDCPMNGPLALSCGHIFCEECVLEWLEKEKTCPLCRAEIAVSPLVSPQLASRGSYFVPHLA